MDSCIFPYQINDSYCFNFYFESAPSIFLNFDVLKKTRFQKKNECNEKMNEW